MPSNWAASLFMAKAKKQEERTNDSRRPITDPLLGVHCSTMGGIVTAFDRAETLGINTFQLFVKNNKQWFAQPLEDETVKTFLERREKWKCKGPLIAHACYLINLGSLNPIIQEKSRKSFTEELLRADRLGVDHFVFHPGCHTGSGEEAAIDAIANALNDIHREYPEINTKTTLEITAGQGSSVGCSFIQLEQILAKIKDEERMRVCLDTCHMFAAGYDIRTAEVWEKTWTEFEERIGFEKLACVHTNDSKQPFNSRKDRHEHIGKGEIGIEAFRLLMNDERFKDVPKILETPKDDKMTEDFENLAILRGLIAQK
jgi:deoxyribonuclease IV